MIDKPEIDLMADKLAVHTSHVQRDYAFGWLLAAMFLPANPLSRLLVLKGGNCFRKAYFESARYSGDLDFGTDHEVDPAVLLACITDACALARLKSGIEFLIDETTVNKKRVDSSFSAFEVRVYFQSFYGEQESLRLRVSVDVREFDQIFLPVQTRRLIHDYSDSAVCVADIRCLKLEELLAQKLKALLMRQHSPDLFDFVHAIFFQKTLAIRRTEVLSTFFKMTIYGTDPGAAKSLLLGLPFEVIRGFWDQYLSCPKPSLFSFDSAAEWFKQVIADIFGLSEPRFSTVGARGIGGGSTHFSAEFRALMLEAGRLRRVLRVGYDGHERLVEPYALTFKKAEGQAPREYFYVFDTTGGSTGKQSIKAFVADKLHHIEITENDFEPRYAIELAKGGGYFGKSTFSRPGSEYRADVRRESRGRVLGWAPRTRATKPAFGSGATYKFQCGVCSKIFTRSTYDGTLRAHKDKYGNNCFGRFGHQV